MHLSPFSSPLSKAALPALLLTLAGILPTSAEDPIAICVGRSGTDFANSDLELAGIPTPHSVMADGAILATGGIRGAGVETTSNSGVFLLQPGAAPELLLRESEGISTGFFRRAYQMTADDFGNIAILAEVGETIFNGNIGPIFQVILRGSPDDLNVVADGSQLGNLRMLRQSRDGNLAFYSDAGIWTSSGFPPTLAIGADSAPPGLPPHSTISPSPDGLSITDGGNVFFLGRLRTEEPDEPIEFKSGLWSWDGGSVAALALEGNFAPGVPGFKFTRSFAVLAAAETGWLVFNAGVDDDDQFPFETRAFAGKDGIFAPIDLERDSGEFISIVDVANDGTILGVSGNYPEITIWTSQPGAIAIDDTSWQKVAAPGDAVPGADATFLEFLNYEQSPDGAIILEAQIVYNPTTPPAPPAPFPFRGVWLKEDGSDLRPIALRNMQYDRNGTLRPLRNNVEIPFVPFNVLPTQASYTNAGGMGVFRGGHVAATIGSTCTVAIPLTDPPPTESTASFSMRRLTGEALTPESIYAGFRDIDAPLIPRTAPLILDSQPEITGGLVADGVTPLLLVATIDTLAPGSTFRARLSRNVPGRGLQALEIDGNTAAWVGAGAVEFQPEQNGTNLYFAVWPIDPLDPALGGAPEFQVSFELTEKRGDGTSAVILDEEFGIRRPPVFFAGREHWAPTFQQAIEDRRGAGFAISSTNGNLALLKANWAYTRPDCLFHSPDTNIAWLAQAPDQERPFRNKVNFNRGNWRRLVELGGYYPFRTRLRFYLEGPAERFGAIPASITEHPALKDESTRTAALAFPLDQDARIHSLTTRVPPEVFPPVYKALRLNSETLPIVFPDGSDGLLGRNNSLRLLPGQADTFPWASTFLEQPVSHSSPALYGLTESQLTSPAVARAVLDILDSSNLANRFHPIREVYGGNEYTLPKEQRDVLRAASENLAERFIVDGFLGILLNPPIAPLKGPAVFNFEFAFPPEDVVVGKVTWLAEIHGTRGITTDGLTLTSTGTNGESLELNIADGVHGDVVVYASYEANDGARVYSPPHVLSNEPEGATLTGLEVVLTGSVDDLFVDAAAQPTVQLGEGGGLQVFGLYSDGSRLQRYLTEGNSTITSSAPNVIALAGTPPQWTAEGAGTSTITVNAFGQSTQLEVTVSDPLEPLTFAEWKARIFTPEQLNDPAISGDDVDLDDDQLTVILEYLVGGHPFTPNLDLVPQVTMVDTDGSTQQAVSMFVSKRTIGYEVVAQRSPDLETWEDFFSLTNGDLNDPVIIASEDFGTIRQVFFATNPALEKEFFRLSAATP